jgi:hypothetical protein
VLDVRVDCGRIISLSFNLSNKEVIIHPSLLFHLQTDIDHWFEAPTTGQFRFSTTERKRFRY